MTLDPNKLEEASIEELTDYLKDNSDDALNSDDDALKTSYNKAIELLAQKVKDAETASSETTLALETIDKIAEQDSDNRFPAALENYTKHHILDNFTETTDGNYLLKGFDDIDNLPTHLVQKVWDDIMSSLGETASLEEYKKAGNKDLSLKPGAFEKLKEAYEQTPDEEPDLQEMMKILTDTNLIQAFQDGDKDAEKALTEALSAIKRRTNNLAVAPEALKKQLQPIANDLAEKGLEEAIPLYNKHKDKNNYKGWDSGETKFNLKDFPDSLKDKIIKDIVGAIGGGVKKEDIVDKDGDTIVGLKLKPEHSDALKTALTKNAPSGKPSSDYVGLDSFLNDVIAKSWEKTWDSYQKTVLSKADPLDMGVAFCEGILLMPLQNLSTMMANFDEWIKNRNLRLSEDKWGKWNSKDPLDNNPDDNPSDENKPNDGNGDKDGNGGNGRNGSVINIYGPVIGSNLNFGNQNGANIMIGGYDLQQALNAGISLAALMKGTAPLTPQDAHVLGLINAAAAILQFQQMYLKNLYRDAAEHPEMRDFAEKLEAIWNDPNFKGMDKLADLQAQHPDLGKQMNDYLADMLADAKNADMFKLLSETKIMPAEALQALTLLGAERKSSKGNDKKTVKMPDLSKLTGDYNKEGSQLVATLQEDLSEEDLKNPIVKAVLEAYAEKDEAKRKEALSQLNDMVKTEADLAIAKKIANEAQYDKPFDVPEIEHELDKAEEGKPKDPIKVQKNRHLTTHTAEVDLKNKTITFSYKTDTPDNKTSGFCSCDFKNNSITMQQDKGKERTFTKNKAGLWCSGDDVLSAEQQVSLNGYFQKTSVQYDQLQSAENKETLEHKLTEMDTPSVQETKTLLDAFKNSRL